MEANEEKRARYLESIKDIAADKLVYIDESGIDSGICKSRGWGLKGQLLRGTKSGRYFERTNIIAGLNGKESIAPFVFYGSCNTQVFEDWVEQFLITELKQGQVVVMDNATFHKSQKTKQLIESKGCRLIFLPPYSPDLNPIENFWANMKRWIENQISKFPNLFDTIKQFFNCANST